MGPPLPDRQLAEWRISDGSCQLHQQSNSGIGRMVLCVAWNRLEGRTVFWTNRAVL